MTEVGITGTRRNDEGMDITPQDFILFDFFTILFYSFLMTRLTEQA